MNRPNNINFMSVMVQKKYIGLTAINLWKALQEFKSRIVKQTSELVKRDYKPEKLVEGLNASDESILEQLNQTIFRFNKIEIVLGASLDLVNKLGQIITDKNEQIEKTNEILLEVCASSSFDCSAVIGKSLNHQPEEL